MLITHTHARPFGQLLRRLRAAGIPIGEVPDETKRMEARGDIEYRGRLRPPEKWWLVELSSGPRAGKLLIMTEDSSRLLDPADPIDPFDILYVERLQPPIAIVPPPPWPWDTSDVEKQAPGAVAPTEDKPHRDRDGPRRDRDGPRRDRGKRRTNAEKITDARKTVKAIDDHVKEHGCRNEDAFEALHDKLGRVSAGAARTAYYAAKRTIRRLAK